MCLIFHYNLVLACLLFARLEMFCKEISFGIVFVSQERKAFVRGEFICDLFWSWQYLKPDASKLITHLKIQTNTGRTRLIRTYSLTGLFFEIGGTRINHAFET